jgi:hypothetical protein
MFLSSSLLLFFLTDKDERLYCKSSTYAIIDGKIKVIGIPDFSWTCGEDCIQH